MLGKRIINTATGAAPTPSCTTDTVQILDGSPFQSIATYQFENNANDLTTNYNGTAANVTYGTGEFGQAAVFNGSSSYIQIPSIFSSGYTSSVSFSVWFNTSINDANLRTIIEPGENNSNGNFTAYYINGVLRLAYYNLDGSGISNGTTSIADGNWHNLTAVLNNSTGNLYFYLDGNSTPEISHSFTSGSTIDVFTNQVSHIGVAFYTPIGYFRHFNGKIDQVRIYNKALSADNVATLYAETLATSQTNISLNAPSCIAYYKMSDATDETGSYDGTPTNVNFNVAGKFGNAGEFNGSSSRVHVSGLTIPNTTTISLWVKPSNTTTNGAVFTSQTSDYRREYPKLIWAPASSPYNGFAVIYTQNAQFISSPSVAAANVWHHVVCIKNSDGSGSMYVDNVLIGSIGANTTHPQIAGFTYGCAYEPENLGFSDFFDGSIDQIRIFNRAITSDEVETLYNEVECIPTIVPTDHFEPAIYTGNGGTQPISTLEFAPDFVWIKSRTTGDGHLLFDSVRGATKYLFIKTNAEGTAVNSLTSFDSNGFTLGSDTGSGYNGNGYSFVSWNWKAGGTVSANNNTDGSIASTVSANQDAGFSVVKFTGTTETAPTVGHGLSSEPEIYFFKGLDNGTDSWIVSGNSTIFSSPTTNFLRLNTTDAVGSTIANQVGSNGNVINVGARNYNGQDIIAYCFHSVDGYSKIGSYVGTGASGNSIVTGFRPAFVMIKRTDSTGSWEMIDNKRSPENVRDRVLFANLSNAEQQGDTLGYYPTNFLSNGFELLQGSNGYNANGGSYIFMAFAEENVQPEPELANSFNVVTYTGNGSTQAVTGLGFQPDLVWIKSRSDADHHVLLDSVRGGTNPLLSSSTSAEIADTNYITSFDSNGFTIKVDTQRYDFSHNENGDPLVAWCWKASNESTINQDGSITSIVSANPAAGFSVVKYVGTGATASVGHGLSAKPELVFIKKTSTTGSWVTFSDATGVFSFSFLNTTNAFADYSSSMSWNSSVLNLNNGGDQNGSGATHIAYFFHSVDGYQKVGSYTGDGTSSNLVVTGFQPRFVMFKKSSSTGNWYISDNLRRNGDNVLRPNTSESEFDGGADRVDFESNGFRLKNNDGEQNGLNQTYIYLAIA